MLALRIIAPIASPVLASVVLAAAAFGLTQTTVPPGPTAAPGAATSIAITEQSLEAARRLSEAHGGRAFLVAQNGVVLAEHYARGWTKDTPHPLASGTKSFSGTLAACALEDGLIASLDEKVADTILEWKDDPKKSEITVLHLLTLTSGLPAHDESLGPQGAGIRGLRESADDGPIARRMRERLAEAKPADRFAAAVRLPAASAPGERFQYGPSHFYAFGEFLERKLKASNRAEKTFFDYLNARILRPCGLEIGLDRFAPDAAAKPNLPGGGHLTAREWAAFGAMIAAEGVVVPLRDPTRTTGDAADARGAGPGDTAGPNSAAGGDGATATPPVRVVASEHLARCFEPSARNSTYGLTWWLLTGSEGSVAEVADGPRGLRGRGGPRAAGQTEAVLGPDGRPVRIVMAAGAGKQRLYVLPDLDVVVVRFAGVGDAGAGFNDAEFLRALLGLEQPKPSERGRTR
jgi:CubicO group peptidase (beta-lactamase class C family)